MSGRSASDPYGNDFFGRKKELRLYAHTRRDLPLAVPPVTEQFADLNKSRRGSLRGHPQRPAALGR